MPSILKMFQIILLTLTLSYAAADSKTTCSDRQLPVTNIVNSFSFHLEQIMDTQENYFFSPLSISLALAMVYIGSRGETKEQIAEALEYDVFGKNCLPNKLSENFRELINLLTNEGEDYSFHLANGAFMQKGLKISQYYSTSLEKYFNSKINFLNFAEEQQFAMTKINEWVANNTRGKIPNLLVEPLNPMSLMVLVNAVYFKGLWDLEFDEEDTIDGIFYRINNTPKTVPFMQMQSQIYNYYDPETKHSLIELEYKGGNISMILILPNNPQEFPRYELTNELLCDLRKKFQYTEVRVIMPRFNLEFQRELSKDMIAMGIKELFTDRADLTGIRERKDLHVSLMLHKAVIEVNEKGSVATSLIGVIIDGRNKVSKTDIFRADHPFLFYIIHKETNTILFSGRVMDP